MTRTLRSVNQLLLALCVLLPAAQPLCAQTSEPKVMPRVSIVHPGAQAARRDLKALFDLTSEKEREQWENVRDFMDQFVGGVDEAAPIRVDVLVDRTELPVVVSIPVDDIDEFRDNIDVLGIVTEQVRRDRTLYTVTESYEGFMRYLNGYATFALKKNDVAPIVLGDRVSEIAKLLERGFNVGCEVVNSALDADAQDARRKKFADVRENLMAAIKKTPNETQAAYELRRAALEHQLSEIERLLAETHTLTAGWKMEPDASSGYFTFDLKPIADTGLAKTVQAFGKSPSMFANIARSEDSVLSIRINHPLDELRQKNFNEFWTLTLPDAVARIDESDLGDDQKRGATDLVTQLLALLKQGTDSGVVDSFVEATRQKSGNHCLLAGLKVPAGSDLLKFLELIPAASPDQKLELNVEKVGETSLHKLTVKSDFDDEFKEFFGDDSVVWIGTSSEALWFATGDGAKAQLRAAIESLKTEVDAEAERPAIDITMHLRPLINLHARIDARRPMPRDPKARKRREELRELRRKALDAITPEDDLMKIRMARVEDHMEGRSDIPQGALRLVGKLMAEFSAENLALE